MELLTSYRNVWKDVNTVWDTWKRTYEDLFNVTDCKYNDDFLSTAQQQLEHGITDHLAKESEILNNDISDEDVK